METPFSTSINTFYSTKDETKLYCGSAMNRHIVQICNIRIFCPDKEILVFNDNASGAFCHAKLHLKLQHTTHTPSDKPSAFQSDNSSAPNPSHITGRFLHDTAENIRMIPVLAQLRRHSANKQHSHWPHATAKRRRQIPLLPIPGDSRQDKQGCQNIWQTGTHPEFHVRRRRSTSRHLDTPQTCISLQH